MDNEEKLEQIRVGKFSVVVVILTLIHSLYLINIQEKKIKKEPTISNLNITIQSIINRFIVLIVTLIYLYIQYVNYVSLVQSKATEEELTKQKARIVVFVLAFLSVLIDVIIGITNYFDIKNENINKIKL